MENTVKKILLLQKMDESGTKILTDAGFQVDVPENTSEAALCAVVKDYEAIIVRSELQDHRPTWCWAGDD